MSSVVWEGVHRVAPQEHWRNGQVAMQLVVALSASGRSAGLIPGGSFNLGEDGDFRVPDLGHYRQAPPEGAYVPTAALVVEVLSPGDETFAEFDFYASHGVEELWVVDPLQHSVPTWQQQERAWQETGRSGPGGHDSSTGGGVAGLGGLSTGHVYSDRSVLCAFTACPSPGWSRSMPPRPWRS